MSVTIGINNVSMGRVRDWHSPRNNDCAHNMSPGSDCCCKRPVNRKPFRVVRVNDTSVDMHKISGRIVAELHPNGILVLREAGRRKRYVTTLGTIYAKLVWHEAITAAKAKKQARKARRSK